MVIRILKELSENFKEHNENFNSMKMYIDTIKKMQSETNYTLIEIKNN